MAEKINELEHTIGTVLPSHFKDLLMQNNVCKPHKNHYKDKETEFTINYFLGFSENKTMILSQHTTTMRAEYQRN